MEFNKPECLKLTGNVAENFRLFKEDVQVFFEATETTTKPMKVQVARLLNLIGTDGVKIYKTFNVQPSEETVEIILGKLEEYCTPKRNEIMVHYTFFTRKQIHNETFDNFYTDLRYLSKTCNFGELKEKMLKIQIVLGLYNKNLQSKLLKEDLTLTNMVNHCLTFEKSEMNRKLVEKEQENNVESIEQMQRNKFEIAEKGNQRSMSKERTIDNSRQDQKMMDSKTLKIPVRWLDFTPYSTILCNRFLAFKTPLNTKYEIPVFLNSLADHEIPPTRREVKSFLDICWDFVNRNHNLHIGVHCTHGINQTGFLIVAWLIEVLHYNVNHALQEFATARYSCLVVENNPEIAFPSQNPSNEELDDITKPAKLTPSPPPFMVQGMLDFVVLRNDFLKLLEQTTPLTGPNGELAISEKDKAELFETHLSNIFTPHSNVNPESAHFDNIARFLEKKEPTEIEINKTINLEKKLRKIYRNEAEKKLNDEIEKQKAFEPITKELKNVEEAIKKTDDDIKSFLVPIDLETEIKNSIIKNKIGVIAAHYLHKLSDNEFGIFHNHETNMHMIGKNEIHIKDNDIILNEQTYKGTQGLWRLLTYNKNIDKLSYSDDYIKNYEKILIETGSLYHNNNTNPKNVKLMKMKNLHEGSGLINYTENPIQYTYIDNLNELLNNLYFIAAEEGAGAASALAGGISSIANTIIETKHKIAVEKEQERQNKEMEKIVNNVKTLQVVCGIKKKKRY
ncbi:Protein-tyrosine phosphatase-like,Dual specificity phosphatase, catalytic domain,Tyrosine, partial [Cinara cedri]